MWDKPYHCQGEWSMPYQLLSSLPIGTYYHLDPHYPVEQFFLAAVSTLFYRRSLDSPTLGPRC